MTAASLGSARIDIYAADAPMSSRTVKDGAEIRALAKVSALLTEIDVRANGAWIAAIGRALAGEPGEGGTVTHGDVVVDLTAVGPEHRWLCKGETGELVDHIPLPGRGGEEPGARHLQASERQVLVASDGKLLVREIRG